MALVTPVRNLQITVKEVGANSAISEKSATETLFTKGPYRTPNDIRLSIKPDGF